MIDSAPFLQRGKEGFLFLKSANLYLRKMGMGSGVAREACCPLVACERLALALVRSEELGVRSGGASRKIIKRRRILIVLRAIVISSEGEKSFLHNGYRNLCPLPTFSNTSRFPLPKIRRFPACNRDPSTSVGMTTALNSIKILRRFWFLCAAPQP